MYTYLMPRRARIGCTDFLLIVDRRYLKLMITRLVLPIGCMGAAHPAPISSRCNRVSIYGWI
jgi:hypothetical protein